MKAPLHLSIGRDLREKVMRKAASLAEIAIHRNESAAAEPATCAKSQTELSACVEASAVVFAPPVLVPPSIGLHNQSLMSHVTYAKRVAVILARRGCVVKSITITPAGALVALKSTRGSRALGGEQVCHAVCGGKDERTYEVLIDGVRVQWTASRSLEKLGAT